MTTTERTQWFPQSPNNLANFLWWLFSLLLCSHFTLVYGSVPDFLDLTRYAHGSAALPYQTRVLPMYLFRLFGHNAAVTAIAHNAPKQFRDPYQVVQLGLVLFSMIGSVLASYGTLSRLTGDRQFSRWSSLFVVYMAYFNLAPGWGLAYSLPYDTPSLFFFCLGVYLVVSKKIWIFYGMLPFADANRETTCFLTVFYLIWHWNAVSRPRFSRLLAHAAAQVGVWAAIRLCIGRLFAGNPTGGVPPLSLALCAVKLPFNLRELIEPQQWPVLLSICGFLLPAVWLGRRWIREPGIAWACAIIFPLWFAGMMLVGIVTEIRVFSELSAFALPALGLIVYNRFRPVAASGPADLC